MTCVTLKWRVERILFWRVRPEVGARLCAAVLRSYFICGERRHSSDWRKEALVETQRTCGVFCKLFCKPGFLRAEEEEEEAEGWGMNWKGRRRREKRRGGEEPFTPIDPCIEVLIQAWLWNNTAEVRIRWTMLTWVFSTWIYSDTRLNIVLLQFYYYYYFW